MIVMRKRISFIVLVVLMLATTIFTFNALKGFDIGDPFETEFDDE